MTYDLVGRSAPPTRSDVSTALHCYQTPSWACEAIVELFYSDLGAGDVILEPACGEGHFLEALPAHVPAIGIELDPVRAAIARERTGRQVIVGDVRNIDLEETPTLILGNLPFESELVDQLLERAFHWLPDGGRCGLLLPAFILTKQTRMAREAERWSIASDLVPRDLFPGPRLPLAFVRFEKRRRRTLVGFALFREASVIRELPARIRAVLKHGRSPVWRTVVEDAMRELGGEATLDQLYRIVGGRRPTSNPHWRAKVRQVVHCYATHVGPSTYRIT
jgi:hypothetical protein